MSSLQPQSPQSGRQSPIPPLTMLPPSGSQTHSGATLFPSITTTPNSHPPYPTSSSGPPSGPPSAPRFPPAQITQPNPSKPPIRIPAQSESPFQNFSQKPTQSPSQFPGSTVLTGVSTKLINSSLNGGEGGVKGEFTKFFSFDGIPYDVRILLGVHFVVVLLLVFVLVYVVTGGRLVGTW